jgi:hypothetical protein
VTIDEQRRQPVGGAQADLAAVLRGALRVGVLARQLAEVLAGAGAVEQLLRLGLQRATWPAWRSRARPPGCGPG